MDVLVEAFNLLTSIGCHTRLAELLADFLLKLLRDSMKFLLLNTQELLVLAPKLINDKFFLFSVRAVTP